MPIFGLQNYVTRRRGNLGRGNKNYNQKYLHAGRGYKPAKQMKKSSS